MAKLQHSCPTCGKVAELVSDAKIYGNLSVRTYKCGHSETYQGVHAADKDTLDIQSIDGKHLFPFQLAGAQFAEAANLRCLIADEMGLGKTPQSLAVLKGHSEAMPALILCKSGLRVQWMKEAVRWCEFIPQVIDETYAMFIPGFQVYIVSIDSAWRIGHKTSKLNGKITYVPVEGKTLPDQIKACGIKTIVIDECQLIKNPASKRTQAIRDACRQVEHIIALSGTPIKNNAAEYFPILNILRPEKFPNHSQFIYGWCDSYFDGYKTKTGGLKNATAFLNFTRDFIIRRERAEVLPDLPLIWRQFSFCELGEMVEQAYLKEVKEFQEYYNTGSEGATAFERSSNILAYLSRMRHLTGLAKVDPVCEYVEEFITTTNRKIMIFVHHKDVGASLALKLEQMSKEWPAEWGAGILQLTSDMDAWQRDEVVSKFRSDAYRVLIGSTLASGEGLNLQFCSDCIMMERQWNPANEEQAEARFPRPGSTADKINANYFIATGTVDEFFSTLVEQKREIVNKTMKGEAVKWDQSSLMTELAQVLAEKGGKKWGF